MKKFFHLFILGLFSSLFAQGNATLEISGIQFAELKFAGFRLAQSRQLHIEAIGAGYDDDAFKQGYKLDDLHGMFIYAWMINGETRELVWRMTRENTEIVSATTTLRKFSGDISLPPGRYEIYFYAERPKDYLYDESSGFPSLGKLLRRWLRGENWEDAYQEEAGIKIHGVDEVYSEADIREFHQHITANAIAAIIGVENSDFVEKQFSLANSGLFEIYALGEAVDGEDFDYGWIINEDNDQKIWETLLETSAPAGGAFKNRLWRARLQLAPGKYSVHYVTDGSHSPRQWNATPPYDPAFWGITITGVPGFYQPGGVKEIPSQTLVALLEITRTGNDAFLQEGFQLTAKTRLRIQALGEGYDNRMSDYGWITDARTNKVVWEMPFGRTRHAGGALKNRLIDETIELPPGIYWVYYLSDESHAFPNWNDKAPRNPDKWGITVYVADAGVDPGSIRRLTRRIGRPIVALTPVRDNEMQEAGFKLEREKTIRIYAVGEGRNEEMFDYGWIVNERTGGEVWRMEYRKTRHAGGAAKNRLADEMITLPAGRYRVYFRSDKSHAYNNWNSAPPDRPERWGITLYGVDSKPPGIKVSPEPPDAPPPQEIPLITLTGIRNDELVHLGFAINKDLTFRIVAVGEGRDGEMYDFGWIVNMETGEKIWEMDYQKTRHAGGASKNRLADELITLPAGSYAAYYRSDASHAFNSWNQHPPNNPGQWGITLFLVGNEADRAGVKFFAGRLTPENVIARIVHVGNEVHLKKNFHLDQRTTLRIYAIGEGGWDEMYDYGWIEHLPNREVVWIMSYDKTRWAGGARKNRLADMTITLAAGEYILHYVTDASHSFAGWNSPAPDDQVNYGITLYRLDARD